MSAAWSALVAGQPRGSDRLCQGPAQRADVEGGHGFFRRDDHAGSFAGELAAAIELQPHLGEQLGGQVGVVTALRTPEPETLLPLLQVLKGLLQLLYRAVEGGRQEVKRQAPAGTAKIDLHPNAVLSVLLHFHGAL